MAGWSYVIGGKGREEEEEEGEVGVVRSLLGYVKGRGGGGGGGGGEERKVFYRGAPDVLLDVCGYVWVGGKARRMGKEERGRMNGRLEALAQEGLRVLGFAVATGGGEGGRGLMERVGDAAITGFLAFQVWMHSLSLLVCMYIGSSQPPTHPPTHPPNTNRTLFGCTSRKPSKPATTPVSAL